jgi:hypothetical protein
VRRARRGTAGLVAGAIAAVALGLLIPMPASVPTRALIEDGYGLVTTDPITDHVVVISIDGLRPDAIEAFGATEILRLMGEGRHRSEKQTPHHVAPPRWRMAVVAWAPAGHSPAPARGCRGEYVHQAGERTIPSPLSLQGAKPLAIGTPVIR